MRAKTAFEEYLVDKGLKTTKQRDLIVSTFLSLDSHIGAEELYQKVRKVDPKVGLATVYRTLRLLSEAGVAREHKFGDACSRYEPLGAKSHHDHLICVECGSVEEFENRRIEELQERIAEEKGFDVMSHRLEIYGVCGRCARSGDEG
ncbi:MAG: Fur family transcriptional regulator [Candidatus Aquicultorales bacterium]